MSKPFNPDDFYSDDLWPEEEPDGTPRRSDGTEEDVTQNPVEPEDAFHTDGFDPDGLDVGGGDDFNIEDYTRLVNFSDEEGETAGDGTPPLEDTGEYTPVSQQEHTRMTNKERRRRARARMPVSMRILRGCLKTVVYLLAVVLVGYLIANFGWKWSSDMLALNKEALTATVELTDEMFETREETDEEGNTVQVSYADMDAVADALKEQGLIQYPWLFKLYAGFSHKDTALLAGSYELNTDMDYSALLRNMGPRSSSRTVVKITIPEGYTLAEIFQALADAKVCTAAELEEAAANHDFDYDFLDDSTLGNAARLEGYLFPDTYEFYQNTDAVNALDRLLSNFDKRVTQEMRDQAANMGYSVYDILKIAAIIEKETDGTDQAKIASVIYNRLDYPDRGTLGYLQMDSTVQYALDERKENLTYEDLEVDSPYNTYKYAGLPAGPICNPGLAAIQAALNPEDTDYFYFVLGDDGVHHFFETHDSFVEFRDSQTGIPQEDEGETYEG